MVKACFLHIYIYIYIDLYVLVKFEDKITSVPPVTWVIFWSNKRRYKGSLIITESSFSMWSKLCNILEAAICMHNPPWWFVWLLAFLIVPTVHLTKIYQTKRKFVPTLTCHQGKEDYELRKKRRDWFLTAISWEDLDTKALHKYKICSILF